MSDVPTWGQTVIKAALSSVPYAGGPLGVLYDDVMARRRSRVERVAEEAFQRSQLSQDAVVDKLSADPRLAELLIRATESAMTSALNIKVVAFGRLVGDAVRASTDAEVDDLELLTLALADLEAPHVAALARLADFPSDADLYAEYASNNYDAVNEDERRKARMVLQEALPTPVISALVRHGLLSQKSGYGLYIEGVTDFGRLLLEYLKLSYEASEST